MAKLFSFRRSKCVIDEQQNERSSPKARTFRKLLRSARSLFHKSDTVELSPPFEPLPIPSFTERTGGLQREIDGELSLLCGSIYPANHSMSSSTFEKQMSDSEEMSAMETKKGLVGLASFLNDGRAPSTFGESPSAATSIDSLNHYTCCNFHSASKVHDDSGASAITSDSPSSSQPEDSFSGPISGCDRPPELSTILEMVRRTLSHDSISLSSSMGIEQLTSHTLAETINNDSPPSDWIDRVVDENLRQDLLHARFSMRANVLGNPVPVEGFQNLCSPEASNAVPNERNDAPIVSAHVVQLSLDFANARFFRGAPTGHLEPIGLASLLGELEASQTADQEAPLPKTDGGFCGKCGNRIGEDRLFRAQTLAEIDNHRRHRIQFSQRLESALSEQEANLRSGFQKELSEQQGSLQALFDERHGSSAQLHEIEMLNLQDDHEAEVKELKQTAEDLRARLVDRAKSLRTLRYETQSLRDQCSSTKHELQKKFDEYHQLLNAFQEVETLLQEKVEELYGIKGELARTRHAYQLFLRAAEVEAAERQSSHMDLSDRYNALLTGFNQLKSDRQANEAQLEGARRRLEGTRAALQAQQKACEDLRARHDRVVAKKVKDFSWHVAHNANPLSMKPMNTEDEIAEATKQLRGRLEEEIQASADLRRQLDSAQATGKAKVKKLKRVLANQSQEKVILEMALTIAQNQRDHRAEQYDELAAAMARRLPFSSSFRGLAERHLALQETRFALEAQLLEAKIRGDRATLECAVRKRHEGIKLEKRDAEIATWKHKHQVMKQKFEYENGMVRLYKDVIDKEIPGLRSRNSQVERMLEDQITNNVQANHLAVLNDLHSRLHKLKETNQYWENEMSTFLQEYSALEIEWNMFSCSVFNDLTNARGWRNDRDRLELENVAFREHFSDELVNEPLAIPSERKTSNQIEEDFKLESIDDALLKQFRFTWGALPKAIMERDAPPWEHIRFDMEKDIAEQKKQWIDQRDAMISSFKDENVQVPDDDE